MDNIKVTLELNKQQLVDIIADWLLQNQDYTMTPDEKSSVRFQYSTQRDMRGESMGTKFKNVSMDLKLDSCNFNKYKFATTR